MPQNTFTLNQQISDEESYHLEFKEIKGKNPINSIKNVCDEYVVAFLNYEGGTIMWGITDDKKVTGVSLSSSKERDELSKSIDNQLNLIKPSISPSEYRIVFHPILQDNKEISGLFIVEIEIAKQNDHKLYSTGSNEVYIKTRSGRKKLSHEEVLQEHKKRLQIKIPETQQDLSHQFTLVIDEDGNVMHEDIELWAIGAEAFFSAKNNHPPSFSITFIKLEELQIELSKIKSSNLSANERLTKVSILDQISKHQKTKKQLDRALQLLFSQEVRHYVNDPYEIGLAIRGLCNKLLGKFNRTISDQGLDIWRKDYQDILDINAVAWVPRESLDKMVYMLLWSREADLYDLGQKNMMEKAIPSILLELAWVELENPDIDLSDLLNLSKWSIGIH